MKKIIYFIIPLALFYTPAKSQNMHLNLYGAYAFPDQFDSYYDATDYYDGQIQGGFQWGGGLEFLVKQDYGIELLYYREDTHAPTEYYNIGVKNSDLDLGINYIMAGGDRYFGQPNGRVQGYGGLLLGMMIASIKNPDTNNSGSTTKFAWGIRGGAVIWASDKVGVKLQIQLLSAVQAMGGGLYFGTSGAGAGVTAYSSIYQFGMGGGLTFRLGN